MKSKFGGWLTAGAVSLLLATSAHADLAGAEKAYAAQDFPRAFALFSDVAMLGNVYAQEALAVMYVNGEGVKRDNVLGYAWASIAVENGGSDASKSIIEQLKPHLNDAAKARIAELQSSFGKAALQEKLLPAPPRTDSPASACTVTKPANPDDFFPQAAASDGIGGTVLVEVHVSAEGRAHHAVVLYSVPEKIFDDAGRAVAMATGYTKLPAGMTSCAMRFKVKFPAKNTKLTQTMDDAFQKSKELATKGDPASQVIFGLLQFDRSKPTDPPKGPDEDWFLKAAQSGLPYAQYLVGVGLAQARTGARETEVAKGLIWLKIAAAAGDPDARFALANYTLLHDANAASDPSVFAWLEDATKAGHRDATLILAALLAASPDATRRDPKRALGLLDGELKPSFDFEPLAFEIRAAANAQLRNFDMAQEHQKRAIRDAKRLLWDTAPLEARLASYQKSTAITGNLVTGVTN